MTAPYSGRLLRAQAIIRELATTIQTWAAGTPWTLAAEIAPDRLSYRVLLRDAQQPPLEDWGYRFGEAVHQLRAALENYLIDIAKEAGITDPKELKRIQFPISATEQEWKKSRDRIASLPARARSAIEQVQPFKRLEQGERLEQDALLLLREFSNQDKHQARIQSTLERSSISLGAAIEFETEEGAAASVPPDITVHTTFFHSGDVLMVHRAKGRIAKVHGNFVVVARPVITCPDGRLMPIEQTLGNMGAYTEIVLRHISAAAAP